MLFIPSEIKDSVSNMISINYLTIDFEEWYQGLTSTSIRIQDWDSFEKRIEVGSTWLLKTLAKAGAKATFFIVGSVAEDRPDIVRKISKEKHEIGAHGCYHQRISTMNLQEFRKDLKKNIILIQKACGQQPVGFRAPCFSFNDQTGWVWEVMAEFGIRFDSSIFPIINPLYGTPIAKREPHEILSTNGTIWEFPMSTIRLAGVNFPFSGGFYFRVLPYFLIRNITQHFNSKDKPVIFYFHPWEFDPDHPKPKSVTWRERLSHYGGLRGTRKKFERLLRDFSFCPLGSAIEISHEG